MASTSHENTWGAPEPSDTPWIREHNHGFLLQKPWPDALRGLSGQELPAGPVQAVHRQRLARSNFDVSSVIVVRHTRAVAGRAEASLLSRERHRRAISPEAHIGASEEGQLHTRFERRELGRFVRSVFFSTLIEEAAAA